MADLMAALKSYLYGIGWLMISLAFSIIGLKVFDRFSPIDFKKQIEKGNIAFALMMGLFLFGLTFGILYLAANVS